MQIKVSNSITVQQLQAALNFSGLHLNKLKSGEYFLSAVPTGDCDLCGEWSHLIDGCCESCHNNHNLELNNQGY